MPAAVAAIDAALMALPPDPPSDEHRSAPVHSEAVTVTVVDLLCSCSGIFAGSIARTMIGWSSSSIVTCASLPTLSRFAVPWTESVSSPSLAVSSVGVRVKVARPVCCPAGIVRSKSETAE